MTAAKTAKKRLDEMVEALSEEQAERLLPLFERGESLEVIARAIGAEYRSIQRGSEDDPETGPTGE